MPFSSIHSAETSGGLHVLKMRLVPEIVRAIVSGVVVNVRRFLPDGTGSVEGQRDNFVHTKRYAGGSRTLTEGHKSMPFLGMPKDSQDVPKACSTVRKANRSTYTTL